MNKIDYRKRIFAILMIMVLSFSIGGCSLFETLRGAVSGDAKPSNQELLYAFSEGNLEWIKEYIKSGIDVNCKIFDTRSTLMNMPPLYVSRSEKWYPHVAKYLLDEGADPNFADRRKRTLLMHAAGARHVSHMPAQPEFVKMLLDYGAEINQVSKEGYTALDYAVKGNYVDTAKILLENGATLSAQTLALTKDQTWDSYDYEMTKVIFEAGAEAGLNYAEDSLLEAAVLGDSDKLIGLFSESDMEFHEQLPFFIASYCNADALKILLDAGTDINLRNENGTSLLGFSAKNGNMENVQYLMGQGAEMNPVAWSAFDYSPLSLAIQQNNYEMAAYLLSQGAEFDIPEDGVWNGGLGDRRGRIRPSSE